MTTAHRPTWNAAQAESADYGNWSSGGKVSGQFSAKDLPSHTRLKLRAPEQNPEALTSVELDQAEQDVIEKNLKSKNRLAINETGVSLLKNAAPLMLKQDEIDIEKLSKRYDDRDEDEESDLDSSSDEDDEDEEELLQRELEKIKREREEARAKKEEEEAALLENEKSEAALSGNPLINQPRSSQVKRKWNDDVVFKNQARTEPEIKKRFVNDTIRNDFHRRFLTKFMT